MNFSGVPVLHLVAFAIAAFGLLLKFIGLCVAQSALSYSFVNALGLYWYYFFFYLLWLGSLIVATAMNRVDEYRGALLALTAVCLSFLPEEMQISLNGTIGGGKFAAGTGVHVAGLIIFIIPVFAILAFLGTGPTSVFNSGKSSARNEKPTMQNAESHQTLEQPTVVQLQ